MCKHLKLLGHQAPVQRTTEHGSYKMRYMKQEHGGPIIETLVGEGEGAPLAGRTNWATAADGNAPYQVHTLHTNMCGAR